MTKKTSNIILSVIAAIMAVAFGIVLVLDNREQQERYAKNAELNSQAQVERREKNAELEKREQTDSFFQKLSDGFDVNILIVGDSIGMGKGVDEGSLNWIDLMESYLMETYNVNVNTKNISLGYSTCYGGYVRTMALEKNEDFDLALICYGQNDDDKYFDVFYEGVVRAIRNNNKKCSIIPILESSQRTYTDKIKAIQAIAEYYDMPVADTIAPYRDKANGGYNALTSENGIDPNEKGHEIYAKVIEDVISQEVRKGTTYNDANIEPLKEWVVNLNEFKGITAREFKQTGNKFVYTLEEPITGVFGIDYKYTVGENSCKIFIDGKEYKAPQATVNSQYDHVYILLLQNKRIVAKKSIEVRFSTEEQANGFKGICISAESFE